ncbi:MAG: hypothetical protein WC623_22550 [Pedobacter sp.]|uniref:hypothetical protein n=1 Tax=Pedobacter sp. TaxID=1411316 RepID=UPI00356A8CF0
MTGKEIARNYQIPQHKTFGTNKIYYLDDVYKNKSDALRRVKDLRSMKYPARLVVVKKPGTSVKHAAVYRAKK